MLVSDKHEFVMLLVPKTGTRSLIKMLSGEKYFAENIGDHKHKIPNKYQGYYTFTVVRNPYQRMVSLYLSCCVASGDMKGFVKDFEPVYGGNSFEYFLQWLVDNRDKFWAINQSKYIILKSQAAFILGNKIDCVIPFESLSEDLYKLPFIDEDEKLLHVNRTASKTDLNLGSHEDYLSDKAILLINDYCDKEFELGGYKKIE
ncbi:MAG: sulfotransferase family 2 domain-containing protein [Oceanospirillaceae bacterium]|nr:sulfotransferase family 2 domain-containing protein [Oceanospirillaceae bacterium]